MKFFIQKIFFLVFILVFFSLPFIEVRAQNFQLYSEKDIFVEVSPKIPGPNEEVDLHLKSYTFNLNNYYIVWYLNGEKEVAGYGSRDLHFTMGNIGQTTKVLAMIDINGRVFRKNLQFTPSQVDILWEVVDAYTPPFYRGKVTPLKQSRLRITAIPETQLIAPSDAKNLIYYWERDYKRDVQASGFGKDFFEFDADPLKLMEKIKVVVNDRRENSFATNSIDIPTDETTPKILFYRINDKNRVMVNRELSKYSLVQGDTIKLSFHPLNMSTTKENFIDIFLKWFINGEVKAPQDFAKQNELYITTNGTDGQVRVGVELEGIEKLLQTGKKEINLLFSTGEKNDY